MTFGKALLACIVCGFIMSGPLGDTALAAPKDGCKEPQTGTTAVPIFSPPLAVVVIGAGRLQFHSAPNSRCAMNGVFVVPRDEMVSYAQTRSGWSSVMYTNPRTGNVVQGWVQSSRLKETGTVGPRQ
jgi:hypothetical protein